MKKYTVKITTENGKVLYGHGMAENAEEAEEKAVFALLCRFQNIEPIKAEAYEEVK